MTDFNEAAKNINLREPSCNFCNSHEHTYNSLPDGVHIAFPVYHVKDKPGAHLGVVLRGCDTCGHIEIFSENRFREFLGLKPFSHDEADKK